MNILVTAKTKARETKVTTVDTGHLQVAVTEAPVQGKANEAIVKAVAEYIGVAKSNVSIKIGKTAKEKVLVIEE